MKNIGYKGAHSKCCLKDKLTVMAFIFNMWHNMKLNEIEHQGYKLSFNLNDIPDELKKAICKKISSHFCECKHCTIFNDLHSIVKIEGGFEVCINHAFEPQKKTLSICCSVKDECGKIHDFHIDFEVNYMW